MGFDLSSIAKTLLENDTLENIADKIGVSKNDVSSVLSNALPSLLSGAGKQSTGNDTKEGFAAALESHANSNISNLSSFFKGLDITDGSKIISHLLGKDNDSTAEEISKNSGIDTKKVALILAAAAPLLMSLLGKKTQSAKEENKTSSTADLASSLLGNVDLGGLLKQFIK